MHKTRLEDAPAGVRGVAVVVGGRTYRGVHTGGQELVELAKRRTRSADCTNEDPFQLERDHELAQARRALKAGTMSQAVRYRVGLRKRPAVIGIGAGRVTLTERASGKVRGLGLHAKVWGTVFDRAATSIAHVRAPFLAGWRHGPAVR